MNPVFPFSAVVGQETVKLALVLLAINPRIGGLLVSGPRGVAKSTLARSLAGLNSPRLKQMVTLPLGASEEMLTGTLDLQQALSDKNVAFAPGLLSKAHEGLLYVDEVNLLPDSLVDLLLDVAESGVNNIERDGISHQHAAKFVLMGTMNPDEGELRPQLLDRFGFIATLDNDFSPEQRVEIVRRRQKFDADPQTFVDDYAHEQTLLTQQITTAQAQLNQVAIADCLRLEIATRCAHAQVDGLRADLVWLKAACAHAAWQGQTQVNMADIDRVEALVLSHRRHVHPEKNNQSGGSDNGHRNKSGNEGSNKHDNQHPPPPFTRPPASRTSSPPSAAPNQANQNDANTNASSSNADNHWGKMPQQTQLAHAGYELTLSPADQALATPSTVWQHLKQASRGHQGQGKGAITKIFSKRINWFASLLASRGERIKLRFKQHRGANPYLHLVLLDTSASTLQNQAQGLAKGLVEDIVQQAYLKRQQLFLLGFGNDKVDILLAQDRAPKSIKPMLDHLGAGGGTPLQQVLQQAKSIAQHWLTSYPNGRINHYVISDGRVQDTDTQPLTGKSWFIDIEQAVIKRGRGQHIAQQLGAKYLTLQQLNSIP